MKKLIEKMKKGEPVTILAIGDSITWGQYLDKPKADYVSILEKDLQTKFKNHKIKIINKARSGEETQFAYNRVFFIEKLFSKIKPELVFIMYGKNDLIYGVKPSHFKFYLKQIVKKIKERSKTEIVLLTPNRLMLKKEDKKASPYLKRIKEAADEEGVYFIDAHAAFDGQVLTKLFSRKFTERMAYFPIGEVDYIHPNELGHKLIAEKIMEAFN